MSHKQVEDKGKEGFPWTARQKRRLKDTRKQRKNDRGLELKRGRVHKKASKTSKS